MIKCYFVDVKSISSTVPKSKFKKTEIERLADAILATDGLLRPMILHETGIEKYTVIEGHREYYAAVRAKEKDLNKAEMVNAFIIDANSYKSAIEQLNLLTRSQSTSPVANPTLDPQISTDLVVESIERLLPTITAAISTQLQPIVAQLIEHQQILADLKSELVNNSKNEGEKIPEAEARILPVPEVDLPIQKVETVIKPNPKIDSKEKSEPVDILGSDSLAAKPTKATKSTHKGSRKTKPAEKPSASIPVAIEPETQIITTAPSTKTAKLVETQQTVDIGSIESEKSTNALNLINTLSSDDLTLRMQRSGVLPAIIKLIPKIISQRTNQPAQRFDTWEDIITAKISGLTSTKVQEIIKKLK
ncbi:ParB N-terminal domain-containing protein [Chamaesiphon sp.]|uniref:ParB N-terminal domain-containing protein n=1 Tax=Chamaesiphon sp. TaxID=2814140 RepID=UPI0035941FC8